jgi:hypothetical protein
MRLGKPITITALLMLAACGKSGDSVSLKNASIDQVAATQKAAAKIQPGQWEMTVEMVKMDTAGGPSGMPTMPKMPPSTIKTCITQEQVDKPQGLFGGDKGMDQFKKNCTYDKFDMSGGHVSAHMHCDLGKDAKVTADTTGTFSSTEITSESTSTVSGMLPGMTQTTTMKMTGHRTGECQPGDIKAGGTKAAG